MASSSLLLPPIGSVYSRCSSTNCHPLNAKVRGAIVQCSSSQQRVRAPDQFQCIDGPSLFKRRNVFGVVIGVSGLFFHSCEAEGAGLPEEEKPRICDGACEKELENVWEAFVGLYLLICFHRSLTHFDKPEGRGWMERVPMVTTESGLQYKDIQVGQGPSPPVGFQVGANYVAMVPSGAIFDSSLEKKQLYLFRVGSGQVIKGLDEGLLSMKVGGKRRLYIPGPLAFPKGLTSAPGRPRVAPNSPVIFDVSLEYIPGLDDEEE